MAQREAGQGVIEDLIQEIRSYADIPDSVGIYAYEKPKKEDKADYIVINHLPFTLDEFEVCQATVNINVHAKDNLKGGINATKLSDLSMRVISLFSADKFINGRWFELQSKSQPYQDDDNTHFINIKLNTTYSNF